MIGVVIGYLLLVGCIVLDFNQPFARKIDIFYRCPIASWLGICVRWRIWAEPTAPQTFQMLYEIPDHGTLLDSRCLLQGDLCSCGAKLLR